MGMDFNLYMHDIVEQGRKDMEQAGYKQLSTVEEVEEALGKNGTTLVIINSVCGCAGWIARTAAAQAIHYDISPDQLVIVFAGQNKEASATARSYFTDYPPFSPSFALLKYGKVLTMVERHKIEGHGPMSVVKKLQ